MHSRLRRRETAIASHEWNGVRETHAFGHLGDDDQDRHGGDQIDPVPAVLSLCPRLDHSQACQHHIHDHN